MNSSSLSDLMNFLEDSPTAAHSVSSMQEQLMKSEFIELSEGKRWKIEPGGRYFVTRNGSSLSAFIAPKKFPKRCRLLASHTDSPGFKLKPLPEIRRNKMILLGVEVYGSPLLSSWFNRDLGIAGRILYQNLQGKMNDRLVRFDRYPLIIPQLAIHLDREVNEKGIQLNKQEHLNAIVGLNKNFEENNSFLEFLLSEETEFSRIISHDLFLFPLEKPRLVGYPHSLLSAYRIDSLASVFAAFTALLNNLSPLTDEIKMIVFWDNEEIGSHTAQGADSPFCKEILERLINAYGGTREDYFCLVNQSHCTSIDLAHALHPNYPEKHDPQHQPILGEGVVLKSHAQQRYATSALSSMPIKIFSDQNKLPLQNFVSRNDIPCGTTIGPLQASLTGMPTVDIGCGQLSMHSCRELMACQDYLDMCRLLESVLHTPEWPLLYTQIT